MKEIQKIFQPKIIPLSSKQFQLLSKLEKELSYRNGLQEGILKQIEANYNLFVMFEIDKRKSELKIYCDGELFEQIKYQVKSTLGSINFEREIISYKGKNLHLIKETLENLKRKIS